MKWFKHNSSASESRNMKHLYDEFGLSGYAWWFLLLELCAERYEKGEAKFTFHQTTVRQKLHTSQTKVRLFLDKCQTLGQLLVNFSENEINLEIPKLLEVRDEYTRKSGHSPDTVAQDKEEEKDKDKEEEKEAEEEPKLEKPSVFPPQEPDAFASSPCGAIAELKGDPDVEETLKGVLHTTQTLWLKSYPDLSWIRAEIIKAKTWLTLNPKRRPRGQNLARFLGNWLSRGWESHRKTIPATKQDQFKAPAVVQFRAPVDCEHCDGLGRASMYPKTAQIIADAEYFACSECENGKTISTLPTSSWALLHGYITRAEFRERRKGNAS